MAIDHQEETIRTKLSRRTSRIQIECPVTVTPEKYTCTWHRSFVRKNVDSGAMIGNEDHAAPRYTKTAGELAAMSWTLKSGNKIYGADIIEALSLAGDQLDREAMDAGRA